MRPSAPLRSARWVISGDSVRPALDAGAVPLLSALAAEASSPYAPQYALGLKRIRCAYQQPLRTPVHRRSARCGGVVAAN